MFSMNQLIKLFWLEFAETEYDLPYVFQKMIR